MGRWAWVWVALGVAGCAPQEPGGSSPRKPQTLEDDAGVVNAAMGWFFSNEGDNIHWDKGERVVLEAEWTRKERDLFDDLISSRHAFTQGAEQKALEPLLKLKSAKPTPPPPLSSLRLDPRVVVGAETYLPEGKFDVGWSPG